MKRLGFALGAIALVCGLIILLAGKHAAAPSAQFKTLQVAGKTYHLEVVTTQKSQEQGLSGRSNLPADSCMLFVFDRPGIYGFWMKDMHFPLDIIWLSAAREVVYAHEDVQPATYPTVYKPSSPSLYTLECNTGFVQANHLVAGQQLSF